MNKFQKMVLEFHTAMEQPIGDFSSPAMPEKDILNLRVRLIQEEAQEVKDADTVIDYAKELADLLYVTFGAAICAGLDMDSIFEEVHKSNMTKVGGPVREDGKRLKPDTYMPPNLSFVCGK